MPIMKPFYKLKFKRSNLNKTKSQIYKKKNACSYMKK